MAGVTGVTGVAGVTDAGTRGARVAEAGADDAGFTAGLAELLAGNDDRLLAAYVHNVAGIRYGQLRSELAAQTRRGQVCPVFFGSAITGAGISAADGRHRQPARRPRASDPGGPLSAGSSRSSAAAGRRRSPTSGCSPGPCTSATGSGSALAALVALAALAALAALTAR
jgi:ribosomal protection tetracycline resistance protein